jgi:hypothetical protein
MRLFFSFRARRILKGVRENGRELPNKSYTYMCSIDRQGGEIPSILYSDSEFYALPLQGFSTMNELYAIWYTYVYTTLLFRKVQMMLINKLPNDTGATISHSPLFLQDSTLKIGKSKLRHLSLFLFPFLSTLAEVNIKLWVRGLIDK